MKDNEEYYDEAAADDWRLENIIEPRGKGVKVKDVDALCLKCPFTHCGYNEGCRAIKNKAFNKYKKLNNYVYENLKNFGNTVLGEATYTTLGEKTIVKDLKNNGFKNVTITITQGKSIIVKADYVNVK